MAEPELPHHTTGVSGKQSPCFRDSLSMLRASLIAQVVKNLPAMQETLVPFLSQEDPLEKREATHPSILGWRIPWTL